MAPDVVRLKTRPEFLRVAGGRRKWVTPGVIVQARRRDACSRGNTLQGGAARDTIPCHDFPRLHLLVLSSLFECIQDTRLIPDA